MGGIWGKILLKKEGHSVWAPKTWDLFGCGPPKNGGHLVCKSAISSQNFMLRLLKKLKISQNAPEACKNLHYTCKI